MIIKLFPTQPHAPIGQDPLAPIPLCPVKQPHIDLMGLKGVPRHHGQVTFLFEITGAKLPRRFAAEATDPHAIPPCSRPRRPRIARIRRHTRMWLVGAGL
jgi:hypothetical protein